MQKSSATCACLPNKDTLSVEIVKKNSSVLLKMIGGAMKDRDRSLDELLKKIYAARVRLRLDN